MPAESGGENRVANLATATLKIGDVTGVESGERMGDLFVEPGRAKKVAICYGGDGESVGQTHAVRPQFAVHFAERRILSTDARHVLDRQGIQRHNIVSRHR